MNDLEKREDEFPSTSTLSKQGLTAVACTAGGIFMLIMTALISKGPFGLIIGGAACVVSVGLLLAKDATDKKAGMIIGGVGILALLSKIPGINVITGALFSIGGVGLIALGIWNAIKFFKGLKKRS